MDIISFQIPLSAGSNLPYYRYVRLCNWRPIDSALHGWELYRMWRVISLPWQIKDKNWQPPGSWPWNKWPPPDDHLLIMVQALTTPSCIRRVFCGSRSQRRKFVRLYIRISYETYKIMPSNSDTENITIKGVPQLFNLWLSMLNLE